MFGFAGKGFLLAVGALVVGLVFALLWVLGVGLFSNATANFRGNVAKRNLVEANGNYRIATYDHFFDICAQVQTREASIKNLQEERPTATPDRQAVIDASVTANRNSRAELIFQYNADATKTYTQAQFRDSHLPYQLDINSEETRCAV